MYQLAPSLIAADYNCLGRQFQIMLEQGVNYLHLDIMDGNFVPSVCMDLPLIQSIRKNKGLTFDAHIMTEHAGRMALWAAKAGADIITVHYEAQEPVIEIIRHIHTMGKRAGIVINPETPVEAVDDACLRELDVFQVMSVKPGTGGQHFQQQAIDKIERIHWRKERLKARFDIEVDGDINLDNLPQVLGAGANIIVSGNALFSGDFKENLQSFKCVMESFERNR